MNVTENYNISDILWLQFKDNAAPLGHTVRRVPSRGLGPTLSGSWVLTPRTHSEEGSESGAQPHTVRLWEDQVPIPERELSQLPSVDTST